MLNFDIVQAVRCFVASAVASITYNKFKCDGLGLASAILSDCIWCRCSRCGVSCSRGSEKCNLK